MTFYTALTTLNPFFPVTVHYTGSNPVLFFFHRISSSLFHFLSPSFYFSFSYFSLSSHCNFIIFNLLLVILSHIHFERFFFHFLSFWMYIQLSFTFLMSIINTSLSVCFSVCLFFLSFLPNCKRGKPSLLCQIHQQTVSFERKQAQSQTKYSVSLVMWSLWANAKVITLTEW